jgi:hypothetical protein
MTETEWPACSKPWEMLEYLGPRADRRRCLLFAAACGHQLWPHLEDYEQGKVTASERYADGVAPPEELLTALQVIRIDGVDLESITEMDHNSWAHFEAEDFAGYAADLATRGREYPDDLTREAAWFAACDAERAAQSMLLRDIFGNPFRSVPVASTWRTAAVALARSMYESRDFSDMPILADALEEAGCADATILGHCRDPKVTHVRGCWVVDLVLGKS